MLTEVILKKDLAFNVACGVLAWHSLTDARRLLKSLPDGEYYLRPVKLEQTRTTSQNSVLWRLYGSIAEWFNNSQQCRNEAGQYVEMTAEIIHSWSKKQFAHLLPKTSIITADGELIELDQTTTKLFKTGDFNSFSDYYEAVLQYFAKKTNYSLNF